jgi:4'-phosphopantetheinyl transferase
MSNRFGNAAENSRESPLERNLEADEVHLWQARLDFSDSTVETLRGVLHPDEAARADRFHAEVHRRNFVVARGCLRKLLGSYLGVDPREVQFAYLEHGKPILAESTNPKGLNFNLAHSGSRALYGLTLGRQIGVDLEHVRTDFSVDEIARRFFSAGEVDRLSRTPGHLRSQAFFNCWTRKEAFIKAIGIGLSLPLDQFEVSLAPGEPAALLRTQWDDAEASRWSLRAVEARPGYVAAVAVEGRGWRFHTRELDEGMLI